jgi:3-oxo-5-alpha-steroid 4-dehydrogenase 1
MSESTFYFIVYAWIAIGLFMFPMILKFVAPYGRHSTTTWGPMISNKVGWIVMESPSVLLFAYLFLFGSNHHSFIPWIFFGFWMFHYLNRDILFPLRLRTKGKKMPVAIVCMAFCFNLVNAFINGYYLGALADHYSISWLWDPRFIIGAAVCISGVVINWQADNVLIHLRKPGEIGYLIPRGGLFTYISCPNLFGEILEWTGFAIMCWSLPALAFAVWTFCNLVPRALHHHRWYKNTFPDYPARRKAVIPWVL